MTLDGKYARTLSESLTDNSWRPTTDADRINAHAFAELLHEAHTARKPPNGARRLPAIKVASHQMAALNAMGGFPWLRALAPHEILMARESFCTYSAKSCNVPS